MDFYSKDVQIVRQSQVKLVFDYVHSLGIMLNVEELQRVTDIFVEYVLRVPDEDLKNRTKKLDEWLLKKVSEGKKVYL